MATGASTADVAVVLVDARKGVLIQSRRHAYITALLGVKHVIVAINKMDLVDYSEDVFTKITQDFREFFAGLDVDGQEDTVLHFVPVSALAGDNVVHASTKMPWFSGAPLLQLLESIPSSQVITEAPFRMHVQRVVRPNLDFRGFAGQIASGTIRVGDELVALPSGKRSKVSRIVTFDGDLPEAFAPLSVTVVLEDEIDISRGDLLAAAALLPQVAQNLKASLVWMSETPLDTTRRYSLKHGSRAVPARVSQVLHTVNLSENETAETANASLQLNGIGAVVVEALQPIAFDSYAADRHTGSFVLIDPQSNATVAAGMIRSAASEAETHATHYSADVVLKPAHALRLEGTQEAVEAALAVLRSAGALKEDA
jgi:sulfate adenylyltransferase large subunit